jgi:hypothetical protein
MIKGESQKNVLRLIDENFIFKPRLQLNLSELRTEIRKTKLK